MRRLFCNRDISRLCLVCGVVRLTRRLPNLLLSLKLCPIQHCCSPSFLFHAECPLSLPPTHNPVGALCTVANGVSRVTGAEWTAEGQAEGPGTTLIPSLMLFGCKSRPTSDQSLISFPAGADLGTFLRIVWELYSRRISGCARATTPLTTYFS